MKSASRDEVASLVYAALFSGLLTVYMMYASSRQSKVEKALHALQKQVDAHGQESGCVRSQLVDLSERLERSVAQQQVAVERTERLITHKAHATLQPSTNPSPNNRIKWDKVQHLDKKAFQQSERNYCLDVLDTALYLVSIRGKFSKADEIPKMLVLLVDGVVHVQYAAPKYGCFGPTEVVALEAGNSISVEYYGGSEKNSLECGEVTLMVVKL